MAHREQIEAMLAIRNLFPDRFKGARVLDIGSLDINGNNRYLFESPDYTGIDLGKGRNVDVECRGHLYRNPAPYDIVISTECFEHDQFWPLTIYNAASLLKPQGLFMWSCATTGRPEHGTRRTTPADSPFTFDSDYYMNITAADVMTSVNIPALFDRYQFLVNEQAADLYFWGIKKG